MTAATDEGARTTVPARTGDPLVARFVRLRLQLTVNAFRRSVLQLVAMIIGALYGLTMLVLAVALLIGLRFAPLDTATAVVVLVGSVAVVGFLVVPLLLGADDTMDPKRFALFGVARSRLATGLAVADLVSIPSAVLALVCIATLVTWSHNAGAVLVALVAGAATVAICTLLARISATGASLLLATRRSREWMTGLLVLLIVLVPLAVIAVTQLSSAPAAVAALRSATEVLSWTPLGASWAAPATVAAGDARGLLQLLVALATVGLLWLAWRAILARTLVTPGRQGRTQTFKTLGWFRRFAGTPAGAVAARSTTYWQRDMRYVVALAVLPVTPIIIMASMLVIGAPAPALALVPVPTVMLFLGWSGHNDVAYDGTAIWLHVVSGVRGRADRIGRAAPVLLLGAPLVVVGSIVCAALYGQFSVVWALIGVGGGLLLTGVGFSFVSSARFPYAVSAPGQSPFQQPQGTSAVTVTVQTVTLFAQVLLALPAVFFGALGIVFGWGWFLVAGGVGLAVGAIVFAAGLAWGGRIFERRGPEMLTSALRG